MRSGCCLAVVVVFLQTAPGLGQPHGGVPLHVLVGQPSIQGELHLDSRQWRELGQASARQRAALQQLLGLPVEQRVPRMDALVVEGDKAIMELLKPAQKLRLRQIQWQLQGCRAFSNPEVVRALSLTDEQQFQIGAVLETVRGDANQLLAPANGGPPPADARWRLTELERPALARIHLLLTTEQKTRWQELLGKPFAGELRYGPPRR